MSSGAGSWSEGRQRTLIAKMKHARVRLAKISKRRLVLVALALCGASAGLAFLLPPSTRGVANATAAPNAIAGRGDDVVLASSPIGSAVRTIQGTVVSIDAQRSALAVDAGGNSVTELLAAPDALQFAPGDVVTVDARRYGDREWLVSQERCNDAPWDLSGAVTGAVENIDRSNGTLDLDGLVLRAHPEQLRALFPGQRVTLQFARRGGHLWISTPCRP